MLTVEKVVELTQEFLNENTLTWEEDGYPKFNRQLWDKLNNKLYKVLLEFYGFNGEIFRDKTNIENNSLILKIEDFKTKMGYNFNNIPRTFHQVNESYKDIVLENINLLDFSNFYPNIIIYLNKLGLLEINNKYYLPFEFIVENSQDLKSKMNKEEWTIIKLFKNYLYGYLSTKNESIKIESKGFENIIYLTYMVMYDLYTKLGQNSIYADNDRLYYAGDKNIVNYLIKEIFKDYEIPYTLYKIEKMIIFANKKYIILNKGEINIKGFQQIKC